MMMGGISDLYQPEMEFCVYWKAIEDKEVLYQVWRDLADFIQYTI